MSEDYYKGWRGRDDVSEVDTLRAQLAEARAENERLRAALGAVFDWVNQTRPMCGPFCKAKVSHEVWGQMQSALARPTGGPRED